MSVSPKMASAAPDLEKGRAGALLVGSGSHASSSFGFPQRRRKVYVAALLLFVVMFSAYAFDSKFSHSLSSSSWNWVKDSMKPVTAAAAASSPLPNIPLVEDSSAQQGGQVGLGRVGNDKADPAAAAEAPAQAPAPAPPIDLQYEPTAALKELASNLGTALPTSAPATAGASNLDSAPSKTDQTLLFLSALKDEKYRVPELQVHRTEELMAPTRKQFLHSLDVLQSSDKDDADLYLNKYPQWLQKHRSQSPLTVFSKSYCPFSARAKTLLKSMGAHFDVYEVDLRDDAAALQQSLKELSGHTTFPTIFVREELIGGFDDLSRLDNIKVLKGILEGAGVQFN